MLNFGCMRSYFKRRLLFVLVTFLPLGLVFSQDENSAANNDEEFLQTNEESDELVVEGKRPKIEAGRGVSLSGDDLRGAGEVGIVEDVLRGVQLLPGVGYSGFFDAMPSIRGGDPGDLTAVLDGFYIENPYHWGGAYSIFDPKMMESARLSHGVFSARYGNTTSGLLELWSKRQSGDKLHFNLGVSTSAVNLDLDMPFPRGGVIVMARAMFWQPFIELAHLFMPVSRSVKQAPYIYSGALSANYNFTQNIEVLLTGFIGYDGIGFDYKNDVDKDGATGTSALSHYFSNLNGFFNTLANITPTKNLLIKASVGAGWTKNDLNIEAKDDLTINSVRIDEEEYHHQSDNTAHVQARADLDWDIGRGFLFAAGVHEMYSRWSLDQNNRVPNLGAYTDSSIFVQTHGFGTSAYSLVEYKSENKIVGAELGLRLDHTYFLGDNFDIQTYPVVSPRFNIDLKVFDGSRKAGESQAKGIFESLTLTLGTGLFSSVDSTLHHIEKKHNVQSYQMKPARSSTTVIGAVIEFPYDLSFNIEGYYKYLFDRSYVTTERNSASGILEKTFNFDGEGHIWGIDLMLQKTKGKYFEGWISYSFNFARYRDPNNSVTYNDWYYPLFHRFNNLNFVGIIKPLKTFHITTRFGFASGKPDTNKDPIRFVTINGIKQYTRDEHYSDTERTSFSMPLDIKFSWYKFDAQDRLKWELYVSVENILVMMLPSTKTSIVNRYTGTEEDAGGMAVMTQLAIPLPSIGAKWHF
ncbi:hypothetical protein FACS189494_06620 [Spirochaetia bacterium]|nr:hypothetical protein FACS189494_06620 [Spirochaetia bacterium]